MQYLGGKHRIAKLIAPHIAPRRQGRLFEPFHGGMSATVALQPDFASDGFEPLTRLVAALRAGWIPPDVVTEETYNAVRGTGSALESFAGFCCSYGGKWFGGYARNSIGHNYALSGRRSLAKKMAMLTNTVFYHRDYRWIDIKCGDTVYCDPPYKGTTGYKGTGSFCHETFWDWAAWQSKRGVLVFVSEFSAPSWVPVLATFESKTAMHTSKRSRSTTEKLYMLQG